MTENVSMKFEDMPNYDELKNYNILFLCKFGSHLYGTATESSDADYKGIYMPTPRQLLLGQFENSIHFDSKKTRAEGAKNSKDDIDIEILSIHNFIALALKGETMAIDMLHAPDEMTIVSSDTWKHIRENRSQFYTKRLDAFIGYARKQAAKYGIKGSRLSDMKNVLDFVKLMVDELDRDEDPEYGCTIKDIKLKEVWNRLPAGEHIHKLEPQLDDKNKYRMYQVAGQSFQETVTLEYMRSGIQRKYDEYGERARLAERNEGIDWKAISHAMRAAYQLLEIYRTGDLKYPLKSAELLRNIKQGKYMYGAVSRLIEDLMEDVEYESAISTYPIAPNVEFWNNYLYALMLQYVTLEGIGKAKEILWKDA